MNSFLHLKIDFTFFWGVGNWGTVDYSNNRNLQTAISKHYTFQYLHILSLLSWERVLWSVKWVRVSSVNAASAVHERTRPAEIHALSSLVLICASYRIMLIFRRAMKTRPCSWRFCLSVKQWWAVVRVSRRSASEWNKCLCVSQRVNLSTRILCFVPSTCVKRTHSTLHIHFHCLICEQKNKKESELYLYML